MPEKINPYQPGWVIEVLVGMSCTWWSERSVTLDPQRIRLREAAQLQGEVAHVLSGSVISPDFEVPLVAGEWMVHPPGSRT